MRISILMLLGSCLLLSSCGAGGGGDHSPAATSELITYHPSGRVAGRGSVVTGTTIRQGAWTDFFDQENGQQRWSGFYDHDAIDGAQPWTEWNLDSSVRIDSSDH